MEAFKIWQDYSNDKIDNNDLLDFATQLWKSGNLRVETFWDQKSNRQITRYSIKIFQQDEEE